MDAFHIATLDPLEIYRFLGRQRREKSTERLEIHLDTFLKEILAKANEFVPSEAGSILLDDPRVKMGTLEMNRLTFIAMFGGVSEGLLGRSIPVTQGIAGYVYMTGASYVAKDVQNDEHFFPFMDAESGYQTRSIIAVPVIMGESICGVLELINRQGGGEFTHEELALLETFAGYISSSIQNALDVLRVRELARRDDLTGLYNDRFLHVRLSEEIKRAEQNDTDLSVIFLDLDFFKNVNDSYGHLVGSRVLRQVGSLLLDNSPPGSLMARYGGDEFVLVLPGFDAEQARKAAETLRRIIGSALYSGSSVVRVKVKKEKDEKGIPQKSFNGNVGYEKMDTARILARREWAVNETKSTEENVSDAEIKVTCSLGVASLIQHVRPVGSLRKRQDTLLRLADAAMYKAKAAGKNKVVVTKPEI